MSEQIPELGPAPVSEATLVPETGEAEEAGLWGSLREAGGWSLIRMLPGLIRSAFSHGEGTPGGMALPPQPAADAHSDHLPDVGLDSYPTGEDVAWGAGSEPGDQATAQTERASDEDGDSDDLNADDADTATAQAHAAAFESTDVTDADVADAEADGL